ncbi:DsbA family protein [Sphingosinicella sp. LHD-64]|uniref:DsbA family protein n=1 Tax=Sphingosinicella sp. LHD-64 TaxID=3072139 RepID=UPI00280CA100|nr:DsbA family protein [Sphingosinicella sp. LHD-64]MDQ8755747.1 DsbA family protein [Sphingosinicella sp. LHD-64]
MAEPTRAAAPGWKTGAIAGLAGILVGAAAVGAWYGFRAPDRAATEQIVRDYILNNGEILPEAMERLRTRQASAAVGQYRSALERPFHGAWAGAEDGDVVLVEFFDYACPYCRASNADVARLLREDPRLKLVWRDYPVLGPASEQAAVASLAAARAGRYKDFHDRLYAAGRPTEATIAATVQATGLGAPALTDEVRTELQRNFELARNLGINGTPTFVVGDRILSGAVGYDALREAVAAARAARR